MEVKMYFLCVFTSVHFSFSLLQMNITKGKFYRHFVIFRVSTPTIYQCGQFCISLDLCKSLSFDRKHKLCYISKETADNPDINGFTDKEHFMYVERINIPNVSIS